MSETERLIERAAYFTTLALNGNWPGHVQHGSEYDTCPACEPVRVAQGLADALVAAQSELAAVREVEAWIQRGNSLARPQHYVAGLAAGRLGAFAGGDTADVSARSIPWLGRALAATKARG